MDTKISSAKKDVFASASGKNDLTQTDQTSKKWIIGAVVSALFAVIALIVFLVSLPNFNNTSGGSSSVSLIGQELSINLAKVNSANDAQSIQQAYSALQHQVEVFDDAMNSPEVQSQAPNLVNGWAENQRKIQFVLDNQKQVEQMATTVAKVEATLPTIQTQYRQLVEKMLTNYANYSTANQVAIANNQVWLAEKINRNITLLKLGQPVDNKAIIQDIQQLGVTIQAQLTGTPAIQKIQLPVLIQELQVIQKNYNDNLQPSTEKMLQNIEVNQQIKQQTHDVQKFLAENTLGVSVTTNSVTDNQQLLQFWLPLVVFTVGLLSAMFFVFRMFKAKDDASRKLLEREALRQSHERDVENEQARQIREENERNQMAILRLLDELGNLAEGDLTVNATVSEDFTGAIADSVNFAIDQLRQLVSAINSTAERVARASDQTQATAVELAEASESQAQEIAGASAAINQMAVSIDQVSANAAESAIVADRSVAIAHNGVEVVQRTIDGMNTIRDQIQETSKRIKRLGESSQEIGDIIGLINDIADQTNILALNAAIQASMAGEAGRGFAVVADEVQRLAERSANATKQIETLVKTIQADTNEAVMSMESTTSEVVRGAKLAKDAGEALEEVQTVSNNLAQLIQSISNAARQQAASAGHISNTMNIIQDITSQTTSGTMATARSVGQLNEMATALQESVSGFKLPEEYLAN